MSEILKENLKKEIEYVLPGDIEKRSFEIIGEELKMRHIVLDKMQEPVTKRVIHTTADFEYATTMTYSENAIQIARNLIRSGADIVTDTNMAKAGINKKRLAEYGGCVHSGFGMGFERLIIYLTGVDNIRDVIPYPRTPNNCDY